MYNPRITMDTVAVALLLLRDDPWPAVRLMNTVRNAAELGRLARRIQRLNEDDCNVPSTDVMQEVRDHRRDQLVKRGNVIAALYGATFHLYGEGGGLWPHIKLADGRAVAP